ncbi:dTDP-4-dehydrorhamnose 3,5-epimerase [Xaviernesmea oryzae]|uniref:dTDP-4-dehydrorhamnose 3,5-epimerase n=1 Tax=Xaviernesmea oryzae TaxID=464029 RepID=A0A1Q9AS96_9HYPH|nr:dTDP-4-dehydrorhamnose 3,5-epimerase family protein [Xaviernesmea oryzae]OLP58259.1 dTDP-4-dehydrorhamnose 3,5-epimerase [Xaviernesmea oryzae]SEL44530.1 dTDP-4-dehydrorhamnose 3,5-epimerase [Xaviernesmea oryzae]
MDKRFEIEETPLTGLLLVKRCPMADARGSFARLFCAEELSALGWKAPVAQINESRTRLKGTVRGLHYQKPPFAEMKLVSCIEGAILDVAVDLRPQSPTYGQHYAAELSAENAGALMIPEGFAHGFQALSDDVRMIYVHSALYAAEAEAGIDATDPTLSIAWPLPVAQRSPRDCALPRFSSFDERVSA